LRTRCNIGISIANGMNVCLKRCIWHIMKNEQKKILANFGTKVKLDFLIFMLYPWLKSLVNVVYLVFQATNT
jgi:hypothetical protein